MSWWTEKVESSVCGSTVGWARLRDRSRGGILRAGGAQPGWDGGISCGSIMGGEGGEVAWGQAREGLDARLRDLSLDLTLRARVQI